jgi:rubrerythrin
MHFIVQLYQKIAESENEHAMHRSVIVTASQNTDARESYRERTENSMQSSIIKLLAELEGNHTTDTVPLIK